MLKLLRLLAISAATLLINDVGRASEIAAVVEEASGAGVSIQPMDLLEVGQVIELSDNGKIVLGYFLSCVRETISGGRVTIGSDESTVENGQLSSEEVDCDGGQAVRNNNDAQDVAGAVFREGKSTKPLPKPDWTLFGTRPLFRLSQDADTLKIERIDKDGPSVSIAVSGRVVDTAGTSVELEPSGLYAVTVGDRAHVLKISPLAEPDAPVISRLVPM